MMSGLSPAMLKVFMGVEEEEKTDVAVEEQWQDVGVDGNSEAMVVETASTVTVAAAEPIDPVSVMKKALAKFEGLVVLD